jgi:hypothetical protein
MKNTPGLAAILTVALATTVASGAAPALAADPLAPARAGKGQCYVPDTTRKTCQSIGWYSWQADGRISNRAELLVPSTPPLVVTVTSPVFVRGEAVCGPLRAEDIAAATVTVDGKPVPEEAAGQVRQLMIQAMQPFTGKVICTTYIADGEFLRAEATIDGAPRPDLTQRVLWVSPSDGYRVAP